MKIAIYPSNHGFGHATRMAALASSLMSFGAEVFICTDRPQFLFENLDGGCVEYRHCQIDVGVVHKENLLTDYQGTKEAILKLFGRREEIVAQEVEFLREHCIDLVVADIPYFIIEACGYAHVPVYGVTNFDWYFIYSELFKDDPEMKPVLNTIYGLYRRLDGCFRLKTGSCENSLPGFRNPQDVGLIVRNCHANEDIWGKYSIPKDDDILLIMFGGEGKMELPLDVICKAWKGTVLSPFEGCSVTNHVCILKDENFSELIRISRLVMCKPGYSSFAEVLSRGKPMLYLPRKNYPEEPCLIRGLDDYPSAQLIDEIPMDLDAWKHIFANIAGECAAMSIANEALAGMILASYFKKVYPRDRLISICDLGSNNFNYLLYNHSKGIKLHKHWLTTGLARGFEDGMLSDKSIENAKENLEAFLEIDAQFESEKKLIATGVSRKAKNADVILDWAESRWGYQTKIISAKKEAQYGWEAVAETMSDPRKSLVLDIGGMTTEISWLNKGGRVQSVSLDFGLVSLIKAHNQGEEAINIVCDAIDKLKFEGIENVVLIGLTAKLFHQSCFGGSEVLDSRVLYDFEELIDCKETLKLWIIVVEMVEDEEMRDRFSMFFVARILRALMSKCNIPYFSFNDDGINLGYARSLK
ncbi:MAG: hypothetical protein LHW60_02750 [Candidatus Cloacimonetes bacterium]|nr:hypothetical protein [Candidatus Cloacimonadota bacterium]NLO44737.1 hypothetical protein [Candidatus Cloacimonadota bacterium]